MQQEFVERGFRVYVSEGLGFAVRTLPAVLLFGTFSLSSFSWTSSSVGITGTRLLGFLLRRAAGLVTLLLLLPAC